MKKLLGLLAVAPMTIAACGGASTNSPVIVDTPRIYLLEGPTGIGAAKLSENDDYNVEVRTGFDASQADILKCDFEMATIPADQAWTLFNNETVQDDCGLQVGAIVASNMLQFVTGAGTTAISSMTELDGKEIWAPASPTVTGIIQEFVDAHDWTGATKPTIVGKPTADILSDIADTETTNLAVLPEPAVTAQVISKGFVRGGGINSTMNPEYTIVRPIGVMAMNSSWAEDNKESADAMIADYKTSTEFMTDTANIDAAAELTTKLKITPSDAIAKAAIPMSAIEFITGTELKNQITDFLNDIVSGVTEEDVKAETNFFYE